MNNKKSKQKPKNHFSPGYSGKSEALNVNARKKGQAPEKTGIPEKIREKIFEMPDKWIHIREMARKLRISPNSVRKYAAGLKKNGILEEKKEGTMLRFRANMDNENYKRNKMIHNLRSIYDSGIVDFLSDYYNPSAIVLFGSYSRGEDTSASDIDIAVLTGIGKRPDLKGFEKKLSRKIELSLFERKNVSGEFFNNLVNGIVLKGFLKNE